jgi:radical SAM superfamily enzyme YgiQ (UPF0313 family)
MKIILLQPPIRDFYDTRIRLQPLGLCMLKSVIKRFFPGTEVLVRDYHQGHGRRSVPVPQELSYLREYYRYSDSSPFSTFHHYYHFGASFEEVARDVAKERPDLIGISSLFSPYFVEALCCAREIKKLTPAPIIVGGSHVTASPLSVLRDPNVDFVIRGEGERPLVEFLETRHSGGALDKIPNLGYKKDGEAVLNPMGEPYPLDELPVADLSDLPKEQYTYEKKPLCFIITSRGCPNHCTFCSGHLTFGSRFRMRPWEDVLDEVIARYREGYRAFDFEDDNLTFSDRDFKSLLKSLIKEFPEKEIRLLAMNGISYLHVDTETLQLMKQAGFKHLDISLVSAVERSIREVNRPHSLKKYLDVVDHAYRLSFDIVSYQILGLPHETLDEMAETMAFMARVPVLIGASLFYLTPGCKIANAFPPMGQSDLIRARSTAMAIETGNFNRDDLHTLFIASRIINFLKALTFPGGMETYTGFFGELCCHSERDRVGIELLQKLKTEKRLYASTKKGLDPVLRFGTDLFFKVLKRAGYIQTTSGQFIDTGSLIP